MKTLTTILVLVGAIVAAAVWRFSADAAAGAPAANGATAQNPEPLTTPVPAPAEPVGTADRADDAAPVDVARLIAAANGADAGQRVEAIGALAQAPRDQALPVLQRIVTQGEPQVDKPAALNSLRELALGQGDRDGKVRAAIREVLYHDDGQNPQLLVDAQEALDVVEELEMK